MILRDYQSAAIDAVVDWQRTRPGEHPLVVLPTGAGKTAVMSGLVHRLREAEPSARVLLLAHRKELLEQSVRTAFRLLPATDIGIYAASLSRKDTTAPLTVASIQSLQRDPYVLSARRAPITTVLVDECHLVPPDGDTGFRKTLAALHAVNPSVSVIGLTATPYRLGTGMLHDGPGRLFSGIAYEIGIPTLLESGYLCPVRPRATTARLSTTGVAVRGDFVPAALAAAVDVDATTRAIVSECVTAFRDRACWLVFACSIEHTEHLATAFRAAGVPTAAIHGGLSASDRSTALAAYRSGAITCAVSCELLTTGFDHPQIDAIAMARPTKSAGLYYQMVGRGFRPSPHKHDCLVLDFAGNVMRHGPVDTLAERITSRTPGEGGVAPAKECPCGALVAAGARVCAECGHTFPEPAPPALVTVPDSRPLLSSDTMVTWSRVTDVEFSVTTPSDPAKRPTLRVDYKAGWARVASEWVCFSHDGFARSKAIMWWRERFPGSDIPRDVDEAYDWMTQAPALHYTPDEVGLVPDGAYMRITGYHWPEKRRGWLRPETTLPTACWTCASFSNDVCTRAGVAPPEHVALVGCELHELFDDARVFADAMREDAPPAILTRAA